MTRAPRGFTLIEVVVVASITALIAMSSFAVWKNVQVAGDLDAAVGTTVATFRRASMYARGIKNDSIWGVHLVKGSATLFAGATYATRVTKYDEVIPLPKSVAVRAGTVDILFQKVTGAPTVLTGVVLDGKLKSSTVNVNAFGGVLVF